MPSVEHLAQSAAPSGLDFWSVRHVVESTERLTVRDDVAEAPTRERDAGVMVSVLKRGALGYAATSDVSEAGLRRAFAQAQTLADASAQRSVFDFRNAPRPSGQGQYTSPNERPFSTTTLAEQLDASRAEVLELRRLVLAQAEQIAGQAEALARRAERQSDTALSQRPARRPRQRQAVTPDSH